MFTLAPYPYPYVGVNDVVSASNTLSSSLAAQIMLQQAKVPETVLFFSPTLGLSTRLYCRLTIRGT